MVAELFLYGFISAFGWWTANHYVIEPHFPDPIEKKIAEKKPAPIEDRNTKIEKKE
jgi:hypothetical protein